jgi:ribosome-binding protein aMBF1 (putative translation factor)
MSESFNLKAARLNAGLNRNQLAEKIGVHRIVIKRLEDGETTSPASAKQVADFFGVNVTDLEPFRAAA